MASETDWLSDKVTFAHDTDGNPTGQDNNVTSTNPNGTSTTASAYDNADYNTQPPPPPPAPPAAPKPSPRRSPASGGARNPDGQLTQDSQTYSGSCPYNNAYQRDYSYDLAGRVVYQGSAAQGANPNNIGYDACR